MVLQAEILSTVALSIFKLPFCLCHEEVAGKLIFSQQKQRILRK